MLETRHHECPQGIVTRALTPQCPGGLPGYHAVGFHWVPSNEFLIVDAGMFKASLKESFLFSSETSLLSHFFLSSANKLYWFIHVKMLDLNKLSKLGITYIQ